MLRVLSTKQLDEDLSDIALDMGIDLTCIDFIRVLDLDFDISALTPVSFDAMVFTSGNAVRSFFENEQIEASDWTKPIYAISGKTKDELAVYGIKAVATAANALELADRILEDTRIKSVLHICGNLRLEILEDKLKASGVGYTPFMVCETMMSSTILDTTFDAIMFYSPSGVESFAMKNKLNPDTLYCCIGGTTAEALRSKDAKLSVVISNEPTPEAMLTAIKDFKKGKEI
jgi:uroporphyrinogen-III synthase